MEQNQPEKYDAVLGGQVPPPLDGIVLGGIEGISRRLASTDVEERAEALKDALQYGELGLNIVIDALESESELLKLAAYRLLRQRTEPEIKVKLKNYIPYKNFDCLYTLEGHTRTGAYGIHLHEFAVSPDNQTLVTYSYDEKLKVWDLRTGELLKTFEGRKEGLSFCAAVAISFDGKTCFLGYNNNSIRTHDLKNGQRLKTLKGYSTYIRSLAVSQDGKTLISGSQKDDVEVWNLSTGTADHFGDKSWYVNFVDISPDGKLAISQSRGAIKVWNLAQRKLEYILGQDEGELCTAAMISSDNLKIVTINGANVREWLLETGELLQTVRLNSRGLKTCAFSPDGKTVWGGLYLGQIKAWNWQTGELLHTLHGHESTWIKSIAISNDGQILVTSGNNGTIQVWGLK